MDTDKETSAENHAEPQDNAECFALKSVPKSIMAGRFAYLSLGVAMAVRASLIPFAMERLQVNEAELGLLLLCLGFGATVSMPVAGALTNKFGCRTMRVFCIPVYYIACFFFAGRSRHYGFYRPYSRLTVRFYRHERFSLFRGGYFALFAHKGITPHFACLSMQSTLQKKKI